jgi:hypothetical protein
MALHASPLVAHEDDEFEHLMHCGLEVTHLMPQGYQKGVQKRYDSKPRENKQSGLIDPIQRTEDAHCTDLSLRGRYPSAITWTRSGSVTFPPDIAARSALSVVPWLRLPQQQQQSSYSIERMGVTGAIPGPTRYSRLSGIRARHGAVKPRTEHQRGSFSVSRTVSGPATSRLATKR